MGFLNWLTRSKEKLNGLQKRIDTAPKQCRGASSRQAFSAADQTTAHRDSFIRNGFKEYTFIANRDCCSVCGELNGKHFPVSGLQIGVNAPPMHEGCRCSIAAYSNRKGYEEWLNSL